MPLSILHNDRLNDFPWGKYTTDKAIPTLGAHVWRIKWSEHPRLLSEAPTILDGNEQERAIKYRKEADRNRFIAGHIVLRKLLGEMMQCNPKDVPIIISKHRKPIIAGEKLHFSLSHSGDYVIVGISRDEIGVDIEHINPAFDYKNVMQYSFNESEISFVSNSGEQASFNFYLLWTRKEALLKATGKGLTSKLSQINALDGQQEVLQEVIESNSNYKIGSVTINDAYMMSVCRSADSGEIVFWEW